MKLLVLGANGQLGRELVRTAAPLGHVQAVTRGGPNGVDLSDDEGLARCLAACAPDWILNAAAYTGVDAAESDRAAADAVNHRAVATLGTYAAEHGCGVVHFSTDYVFAGDGRRPYREDDPVAPINAYGASKLAGERALAASGARFLLLRTAWVYGNHGKNFLRSMVRLGREREQLRIVDDQRGAPTWSRMLAQLTTCAVAELARNGWADRAGTYHLSATGETTWYGFARALLEGAAARGLLPRVPALEPIPTSAFPTPARRPAYSVLDNGRFQQAFGLTVPSWEQQLAWCLEDFHPIP